MRTWFIRHINQSLGPYSPAELKNIGIRPDDFVWKQGLPDWTLASTQPELQEALSASTPPPFASLGQTGNDNMHRDQPSYTYSTNASEKKPGKKAFWILILLAGISVAGFLIYQANQSESMVLPFNSEKSAGELKEDLATVEKQNPGTYIKPNIEMGPKSLFGEIVIKGTLVNNATLAIYKDVVLRVDFLSKTGAVIDTKDFTVYEIIRPNSTVKYKFKLPPSGDVAEVNAGVVSAEPYN